MILWSRSSKVAAWLVALALFVPLFGFPLLTVLVAAISRQWNGVLPTGFTVERFHEALAGDNLASLLTSVMTGLISTVIALVTGFWGALAGRRLRRRGRRVVDALFLVPIAVPSVSVGLGLLVAFSQPPVLLNGTRAIVIAAHVVLVTAFAYTTASAALLRLDPALEQVAASLGARPRYVLVRVTIPLLLPAIVASAGLCFALSMGEIGATLMVYPPTWRTLPATIFGLQDRGDQFLGAAMSVLLLATTVLVLALMSRLRTRASYR
ncbi:ABC transporter permease [Streptomyces sp. NPDC020800]|uniref:ABC transporter permease n=1 Tax=Streptomyces sp. NPDC020800 TaxID=3365092 RepID=UPI00378CD45C